MPRYALRGSAGSPCTDNPVTGEHEHHYGSLGTYGIEFDKPIPVELQREWARRDAQRRPEPEVFVTDHGHPRWVPYDGAVETASARRLRRLAEAAGFEIRGYEDAERCTVEGFHHERRVGFRASWLRGKADFGSWHAPYKTMTVRDERPIGINKLTRTALKDHRGAGSGDTRVIIVSSPHGLSVGVTEVERRVKEIAS